MSFCHLRRPLPKCRQKQNRKVLENNWLRAQESQRAFERELFDRAGFPSIAEQNLEGREVRRLLLRDPYGMLAVPGVELERLSNGRIKLRLQYVGWSSAPKAVDRSAWDKLVSNSQPFIPRQSFELFQNWMSRRQCRLSAMGGSLDYKLTISELQVGQLVGRARRGLILITSLTSLGLRWPLSPNVLLTTRIHSGLSINALLRLKSLTILNLNAPLQSFGKCDGNDRRI